MPPPPFPSPENIGRICEGKMMWTSKKTEFHISAVLDLSLSWRTRTAVEDYYFILGWG
jgi:hypothetical protein